LDCRSKESSANHPVARFAWTGVWLSPEFRNWNLDQHLGQVECLVLAMHGDRDEYGSLAFPRRIASGVSGMSEMAVLNVSKIQTLSEPRNPLAA
jgi:hypothetical protein